MRSTPVCVPDKMTCLFVCFFSCNNKIFFKYYSVVTLLFVCRCNRTTCHMDTVESSPSDSVAYSSMPNGPVWYSCLSGAVLCVPFRRRRSLPSLSDASSLFCIFSECLSARHYATHSSVTLFFASTYLLYLFDSIRIWIPFLRKQSFIYFQTLRACCLRFCWRIQLYINHTVLWILY